MNAVREVVEEVGQLAQKAPYLAIHYVALYGLILCLIYLLWTEGQQDFMREQIMVESLSSERDQTRAMVQQLVDRLQEQAPKKIDEESRRSFLSQVEINQQQLNEIRETQTQIQMRLETIRVKIDGKGK